MELTSFCGYACYGVNNSFARAFEEAMSGRYTALGMSCKSKLWGQCGVTRKRRQIHSWYHTSIATPTNPYRERRNRLLGRLNVPVATLASRQKPAAVLP